MEYVTITRKHKGGLGSVIGGLLGTNCPNDGAEWTETVAIGEKGQAEVTSVICASCGTASPVTKLERVEMEYDERLIPRKKVK